MANQLRNILEDLYFYFRRSINKTDNLNKVEIFSTVSGGGLSGQAGAPWNKSCFGKSGPISQKNLKNLVSLHVMQEKLKEIWKT